MVVIALFIPGLPGLPGSIQASNNRSPWMAINMGNQQVFKNTPLTFLKWWSSFLLNAFKISNYVMHLIYRGYSLSL